MHSSWIAPDAQPCLWMAAGLLNYRLCDRDFDCDHCPLDAALRGESRATPLGPSRIGGRPPANHFPSDRRYSSGHTWVQLTGDRSARWGLDAFAAGMLDELLEVRTTLPDQRNRPVADLCLGFGTLPIEIPLEAFSIASNGRLTERPDLALTAPYHEGWIAALENIEKNSAEELMSADEALDQAVNDLRLFRRQVALEMLADKRDLGRCMADGGELLTDLRRMVGAARYLALLQKLIH